MNTFLEEKVTVRQGNALDLSYFGDNSYDITLLLGPMYHIYTVEVTICLTFSQSFDQVFSSMYLSSISAALLTHSIQQRRLP